MSKPRKVLDLYIANNNIYKCLSRIASQCTMNDNVTEFVVEELLDETIKYLSFIQRRLDEISVDKGDKAL